MNTNFKKILSGIVYVLALLGGLLHVFNSAFGKISAFQMRPIHMAIIGVLAVLTSALKLDGKSKTKTIIEIIADVILLCCVLYGVSYLLFHYEEIAMSAGKVSLQAVYCCTALIVAILYFTYKRVGLALPIVAVCFIIYGLLGKYIPGVLGHRGYTFSRIAYFLYTNGNGLFGTALDVSARYIVLFMIMGQFIELGGTGKFFMAIADWISSRLRGGAAKSSVVASALFGTISGTPIANVMVTGAFTIPMMRKSGFENDFAASVEATASTGGLIMPPMMGAGAFIMAELLGRPYSKIMVAAIIPAVLYYLSLYLSIDQYSVKKGIGRVEDADQEDIKRRLKLYAHTIIPLIVFLGCIFFGTSVFRAAIVCIIVTPIVAAFRKETRMSPKMILDGIADGMKSTVTIGSTCACAGIIIGTIALTGFGFSFAELLGFFQNFKLGALVITALICIVMGMGMPAVASYMITATICCPQLINMGFLPMAAHMFVFYFSCFSSITPPVALATYTAAGLAESNPMKTGWKAFKLALVAFLAPFFFVYSPALIGQEGWLGVLTVLPTALIGTFAFVCGLNGYLFGELNNIILRIILFAAGCLMIVPGIITDLIGIAVLAFMIIITRTVKKNKGV